MERHSRSHPCFDFRPFSKRTRDLDLNERRERYAQEGVRHYFVVDPKTNEIMQWIEGEWKPISGTINLPLDDDCSIDWDLGLIFK